MKKGKRSAATLVNTKATEMELGIFPGAKAHIKNQVPELS